MTLHMVRVVLHTKRVLAAAKLHGALGYELDLGYLVHSTLAGLFDEGVSDPAQRVAPKPFVVEGAVRRTAKHDAESIAVLGYTKADEPTLLERMAFAKPEFAVAHDPELFAVKRVASAFERGKRFGFTTRVCPTKRRTPESNRGQKLVQWVGERDAYWAKQQEWAALKKAGAPEEQSAFEEQSALSTREAVYEQWLREKLEKATAASLVSAKVLSFQMETHRRKTQRAPGVGREAKDISLPDVLIEGVLTVGDPSAFASMLAHGIGRHSAFGYGMLLLRPA